MDIQKSLFEKNQIIPPELWPKPEEDAPWETFPSDYTRKTTRALEAFHISKNETNQATKLEETLEKKYMSLQIDQH